MNRKIFIEYKVAEQFENAFSVTLASVDGLFGVKKQDGTIVVANGSEVSNPSQGVYEYNLYVEAGTVYIISWKIIPCENDSAIYSTQYIGPFSESSDIKSVPDFRGTFSQGTTGTLFLSLTDVHGNPLIVESISLSISKEGNDIISGASPDFVRAGFYVFDWTIASDLDIGKYIATWSYSVNEISGSEVQEIIVSSSGDTENSLVQFYGSRLSDLRVALSEMICCSQKIPVFHEQALPDINNQKFKLTFPRWNQAFGTKIYLNNKLVEDSYEINYFKGLILFDSPLSDFDIVHADYNFRWFEDEQLDRFLLNSLSIANFYPPQSFYDITTVPDIYIPLMLYGAAKDALRELLMCLNFQQPQQVFGGQEAAQKAFSNMETLKKNYEEEFTRLLEQKKYGKYPRTRAIVTPEFTLPGGRSRWFRYMFGGGS